MKYTIEIFEKYLFNIGCNFKIEAFKILMLCTFMVFLLYLGYCNILGKYSFIFCTFSNWGFE